MRDFGLGFYGNIFIIQPTNLYSWKFPQSEHFIGQCKLFLFSWNCDCHCVLVGKQTGAATVENSMEFSQKTKIGTAFWPSKSTAGIIP